jgi:hypothetical protein
MIYMQLFKKVKLLPFDAQPVNLSLKRLPEI